jgi:hypothetical protein
VWSPDGLRLAYGSSTLKERRLSIAAADGTGVAQELPCPGAYCEPTDWSPDGRSLIVNTRLTTIGAGDVWSVSLEAGGSARPILSGPFPEYDARISPNGQWLAYVSEEAGRPVVSVRAMSGPPRRLVVSSDGGSQPVWRRDGQELLTSILKAVSRPVGATPTDRRAGTRCRHCAERAFYRIGIPGHAVRRVARRATPVIHRPDACAGAERHPCRDRVARAPRVGRADPRDPPSRSGLRFEDDPKPRAGRLSEALQGIG